MSYAHRPRIAYPGAAGSYTAEASAVLYPDGDLYSAGTFEDVAAHVRDGEAAAGVLPIENSLAGLVAETCDLLADGDAADRRRGRDAHPALPVRAGGGDARRRSPASSPTPRRCSSAVASSTAASSRRARRRRRTPCARSPTRASRHVGRDRVARRGRTATAWWSSTTTSPTTRRTSPASSPSAVAACGPATANANWRTALRLVTRPRARRAARRHRALPLPQA